MSQFVTTQYDSDEINRIKRKVDGISGPGVHNDANNITIAQPGAARVVLQPAPLILSPCLLSVAGGSPGGYLSGFPSLPSFAYDIYAFGDTSKKNKLFSAIQLYNNKGRLFGVSVAAATAGSFCVSGGTCFLIDAEEVEETVDCYGNDVSSSGG